MAMETVGHYAYFMQLAVSLSDGEQEEEEVDAIRTMAVGRQIYNMISGVGGDQQQHLNEAIDYFNTMVERGQVGMAFAHAAGGIAANLNYDTEALAGFYSALVEVAAADGEIESSERNLLDFAKNEWGL